MSKLTNTQRNVLSSAVAREDGAANIPAKMNKAASAKLAASLVGRELMREVRTKRGMPVWRRGADDVAFSLVITPAGKKMLVVEDEAADARMESTLLATPVAKARSNKSMVKQRAASGETSDSNKAGRLSPEPADRSRLHHDQPRARSKRQLLIDMLSEPDGATIDQMVVALGWLPHTTRAELTRLRQRGLQITRTPRKDKTSLYSLAAPAPDTVVIGKAA